MIIQKKRKPVWWSWHSILEHVHRLGIPNFQRGAVWDTSNQAALLESIYKQSPCGSFVLWQQYGEGVPVLPQVKLQEPMWLVDGQQRTRTLINVFKQLLEPHNMPNALRLVREEDIQELRSLDHAKLFSDQQDSVESESDTDDKVTEHTMPLWLAVLPAMSVFDQGQHSFFGGLSETRSILRGAVFRRLFPHARGLLNENGKWQTIPPIPLATIPMAALLSLSSVFGSDKLRQTAKEALETLSSKSPDINTLDDLLPWGPQFVTGYAYETIASPRQNTIPMTWAHISDRPGISGDKLIQCLKGLLEDKWGFVFRDFTGMLTGERFAVAWLNSSDVGEAIDTYVRINSAGIRVRAEEQALALLTRARKTLLKDLATYIEKRDETFVIDDYKELLTHESDKQMGFPMWMSTVTRYSALSLLGSNALRWLGTSAIHKKSFSYRLNRVSDAETENGKSLWARENYSSPEELIDETATRATHALLLIDSVLSKQLYLDHRMARPQTFSLQPMIDLFYRVPVNIIEKLQKNKSFCEALGRVLHWTLLYPNINKSAIDSLIVAIHADKDILDIPKNQRLATWSGSETEIYAAIRASLRSYCLKLEDIWMASSGNNQTYLNNIVKLHDNTPGLTRLALAVFHDDVHAANSLKHRAVGWLYAIERRNKAREFSWVAQFDGYGIDCKTGIKQSEKNRFYQEASLERTKEADMKIQLYPEKQHVVPFAKARQILGISGTIASASPANAIGNLTWLSRRQNCLDGLADRWTVIDREIDRDNLTARGFLSSATIDDEIRIVVDAYEELMRLFSKDDELDINRTQYIYKTFCEGRKQWIIEEMCSWLCKDISPEAQSWLHK